MRVWCWNSAYRCNIQAGHPVVAALPPRRCRRLAGASRRPRPGGAHSSRRHAVGPCARPARPSPALRRVWPTAHHPPRGRCRLLGGGRCRRRGYAARAAPLSLLQPRQPPLCCAHRSVGGASRRGARPLIPGADRRAPPCPGPPARSAGVRPPPRRPAVCGPAGLRSALVRRHPIPGSSSLLCMPTSFHLVGHHAHLLPSYPV
jgi:hypothetical protein